MEEKVRTKNFIITVIFIVCFFVFFKPLLVRQIILRGDGYLGFNMNYDAIRQYNKALLLEPKNINAKSWLAYAYKRTGQTEKAVKAYEDSLRLTPNNIIAYYELGMVYAMRKDFAVAKTYFLKASSLPKEYAVTGDEDYDFYHKGSLKMLNFCRERLGEN
ncbi:MAG: hypothetical protein A3K83_07790 [Omnitrophica WOR_2 bacterium RBG_13_44_8b]|nr:MAG: hypothetical protein A3K83_07790 [Omnitrophica WOR_2 bacterium RBG_13_44_8b]